MPVRIPKDMHLFAEPQQFLRRYETTMSNTEGGSQEKEGVQMTVNCPSFGPTWVTMVL